MNSKELVLVLHNLRSVYNVGSIFRTADAAGIKQIFLTGTTPAPIDRFGRERKDLAKVALGAQNYVNWQTGNLKDIIDVLRKDNFKILALEQDENSVPYNKKQNSNKLALLVGNEPQGLDKESLSCADEIIEIPMHGKKESLNVAVATAIAIFKLKDI